MTTNLETVKKIVEAYRNFPIGPDTLNNFINSIFNKINSYQIKIVNVDNREDLNSSQSVESYCHTFYRMLGFPVVATDNSFYNPGYFGRSINLEATRRSSVDKKQDAQLRSIEIYRELKAFEYSQKFLAGNDKARQYKIDMLSYPRKINTMKENLPYPFNPDIQSETIQGRTYENQEVFHILRPFKCNADITNVDNSRVPEKNFAAPFFEDNTSPDIVSYPKTYLETVCRIRLAISQNATIEGVIATLRDNLQLVQTGSQNIFENVLKNSSIIEIYISNILFGMFVNAVLQYASKITEYKNTANRLMQNDLTVSMLQLQKNQLQAQYDIYDAMTLFLPEEPSTVRGNAISTSNVHNGVLMSELITLVSSPAQNIKVLLDKINGEIQNNQREVDNIAQDRFYLSGEVLGIGTIDILALLISFWTISKETLVSMIDDSSFARLLGVRGGRRLRSEVVLARESTGYPDKDILSAMKEYDTSVYNLLALADSIIEYSSRENNTR